MKDIYHNSIKSFEEQYFCMIGSEDFLDEDSNPRLSDKDNENIAAKIVINKKPRQVTAKNMTKSYFIKVNPSLQVFNPSNNTQAIKDKTQDFFIHKVCKNEWYFKEVDAILFNKYLNFLKIKNNKLLKDIERDLK